jgi:hypothetical protein
VLLIKVKDKKAREDATRKPLSFHRSQVFLECLMGDDASLTHTYYTIAKPFCQGKNRKNSLSLF